MDAKTIIEPWMNGDPCEGCEDCAKICRKLQDRIDSALAERDRKIERLQEHCAEMTTRCIEKEHEIERLRGLFRTDGKQHADYIKGLSERHAIRIQKYFAEIERLREALREIVASDWKNGVCADIARAALGEVE